MDARLRTELRELFHEQIVLPLREIGILADALSSQIEFQTEAKLKQLRADTFELRSGFEPE